MDSEVICGNPLVITKLLRAGVLSIISSPIPGSVAPCDGERKVRVFFPLTNETRMLIPDKPVHIISYVFVFVQIFYAEGGKVI